MQNPKPVVIVLLGPTASGKTKLALEVAQKLDLSIINVDSRQLFKGMNIGTAKPTFKQQQKIKHLLIDICLPNHQCNLHKFHKIAIASIEKTFNTKKIALLAGGSGLYMKSITHGLKPSKVIVSLGFFCLE